MKHAVTRPWFVHLIVLFILFFYFFIFLSMSIIYNQIMIHASGTDQQADTKFLMKQL